MNLRVSLKVDNSLINLTSMSFSRTLLHGVSYLDSGQDGKDISLHENFKDASLL